MTEECTLECELVDVCEHVLAEQARERDIAVRVLEERGQAAQARAALVAREEIIRRKDREEQAILAARDAAREEVDRQAEAEDSIRRRQKRLARAERREKVARLALQRVSASEIARLVGVHRSTVDADIQRARETWLEEAKRAVGERVGQDLRVLDHDEARLRSRADEIAKRIHDCEGDVFSPMLDALRLRIYDRIMKIMERRAKLMGLDAPVRAELSGPDGGPIELTGGEIARRVLMNPETKELVAMLVRKLADGNGNGNGNGLLDSQLDHAEEV